MLATIHMHAIDIVTMLRRLSRTACRQSSLLIKFYVYCLSPPRRFRRQSLPPHAARRNAKRFMTLYRHCDDNLFLAKFLVRREKVDYLPT